MSNSTGNVFNFDVILFEEFDLFRDEGISPVSMTQGSAISEKEVEQACGIRHSVTLTGKYL